jgi:hypothetical protein
VGLVEFGDGGLGVRVLIEFRIKWVWLNLEMMDLGVRKEVDLYGLELGLELFRTMDI